MALVGWLNRQSSSPTQVKEHSYAREFELEVDSWCYGLARVEGPILPGSLHKVLRELAAPISRAISEGYFFDIHNVAQNLFVASGKVISKKEILFSLLANVEPESTDTVGQASLSWLMAEVERVYGQEVERLKKLWEGPASIFEISGRQDSARF